MMIIGSFLIHVIVMQALFYSINFKYIMRMIALISERASIQMGNFSCVLYQNFLINDLNHAHALKYVFARNPIHVAMFSIFPGEPEARFTFSRETHR